MSEKKPLNRAVKDDHFDVRVSFQRCDDFIELQNCVWAKDVEWRVIECHAPIRRRASRQKNLLSDRGVAHCTSFLTRTVIERCRQGQNPSNRASPFWLYRAFGSGR